MNVELSWLLIALCSLIAFVAAIVTGFSGFGFALVTVPLLAIFIDIKFTVPLVLLLSFFSVLVLSANKLRFFRESSIYFIFAGMVVGISLGTHFLANFDTALLKRLLGISVVLFAAHIFFRTRPEKVATAREVDGNARFGVVALVVGLFSGLAGGLFGTSGPPLVIYVDYFAKNKTAFRSQLLVIILLHDLFRMFLYLRYGLVNADVLKAAVILLLPVSLGLYLGSKMHFQVNERTFSRAVASLLFVSGVLLTLR